MSQFWFGSVDLTDWIERVSIREEYEVVALTRGVQALGGMLGSNQVSFWRIRAEGYAFGDTVAEMRTRLANLRRRGIQDLRWQSDRYTRALLTDFRVDDWQGGALLMPNVQLEFIALPFAYGDEESLEINYPTSSALTWSGAFALEGDYETGLKIDYTFTLSSAGEFQFEFYWGVSVTEFRRLTWAQSLGAGVHQLVIDGETGFTGVITPSSSPYYERLKGLSQGRMPQWNPEHGGLYIGLKISPLPASGNLVVSYRPKYRWL